MKKFILGLMLIFAVAVSTGLANLPQYAIDKDIGVTMQINQPVAVISFADMVETNLAMLTQPPDDFSLPGNKIYTANYTANYTAYISIEKLYDIQTFSANNRYHNKLQHTQYSNTYRRARDAL